MNRIARNAGIIAAVVIVTCTIVFLIFTLLYPPGKYNATELLFSASGISLMLPAFISFIQALVSLPFFVSLYYFSGTEESPLALTGLAFGIVYAVCSGITCFMQFSVVSHAIEYHNADMVSAFSMNIRGSFSHTLNNLGYTFLSLAFLFFSGIFSMKGLQGYIKSAFIVYGIAGLTGSAGYITGNSLLDTFVLISAFPYLIAVALTLIQYINEAKKTGNHLIDKRTKTKE
jgi:hypothetical protein